MSLGNVAHVFIALVVLLQASANGNLLMEVFRKIVEIISGRFTLQSAKWREKYLLPGPIYDGCPLCAWGTCRPATKPVSDKRFNEVADATDLFKNLNRIRGLVNKDALANILIYRSETQRNAIIDAYRSQTHFELRDRIQSKFMDISRYQRLMSALATPLPLFFAEQFANAMEDQYDQQKSEQGQITMVEMLTSLPRCLITKIIDTYNKKIGFNGDFFFNLRKSLENAKMPVEYITVIEKLAKGGRNDNVHASWRMALKDSYMLKKTIQSQDMEKLNQVFLEVFTERSYPQIIETMKVYNTLRMGDYGFKSLYEDMNINLGTSKEIYKVMVMLLTNKPFYFANVIGKILYNVHKLTVEGDAELIAIIRGRMDIDLRDIIDCYNRISGKGLIKDFDTWDTTPIAQSFNEAVLKIIK